MAATAAQIGYGTTVTYASLDVHGELVSVAVSGMSQAAVEATHHSSPNRWREYIVGLKEGGSLSLTFNMDADDITPPFDTRETITLTLPIQTGNSSACTMAFPGFFTSWDPDPALDDRMTVTAEVKVAGEPTITEGAV